MSDTVSDQIKDALHDFLSQARWFGGKGRDFEVSDVRTLGTLGGDLEDQPLVVVHLVEVTYGPGDTELYQVPLVLYAEPQQRLDHAFVGWWEETVPGSGANGWVHAYDALHDRDAMGMWLQAFGAGATIGAFTFHRLEGHTLDTEAHSTLFSGEQSNSSVAYGDDSLMKVFRKVTPGLNPDVEVLRVLTEAGSEHVAGLYGWLEAVDPAHDGEPLHLAMLSQFLRTAADGWDLALASVRGLFADPEVHATDSGGDFAGEATLLGEALSEVHQQMADAFGTSTLAAAALAEQMRERLAQAVLAVPALREHRAELDALFERVADLGELAVQRIHGDLHLGQTLRTSLGWKIVDFEGEPAKPLRERVLPDSPWRDVAGMLRSFDYAPRAFLRANIADTAQGDIEQLEQRADEWANRNRNHFLVAYAGGELPPDAKTLLDAYVADKAVYETVYETRNRPGWVSIPLRAVGRIAAA